MIRNSIIKKINKCKVISFDIFDTALFRNVAKSNDIFKVIDNIKKNDFFIRRIEAEKKAKEYFKKEAPNIDEIYHFMGKDDYNYEIEIEKSFLCDNPKIKEIYDYCLKKKKRIIFVSDMYYSNIVLSEFLKSNDYTQFEKIYVSCEYDKTKYKRSLFDVVIKDLNINPKLILHIGDSIKSDYLFPKMKGIVTCLYRAKRKKKKNYNSIQENMYNTFLNNYDLNDKDGYYNYGFRKVGLLLFSYSVWLKKNLMKKGVKKVYFLSRDGFLMKRAFDIINDGKEIESRYLYVSRRSLNVPNLWKQPEFDMLDKNISMSNYFNIETFIKRIGLDYQKYKDKISRFEIDDTEEFSLKQFKNNKKLRSVYNSIIKDVVENSKKEYENLIEYLTQEEFSGKIAIVDIGWHGSMQENIEKICSDMKDKTEIYGYYFGQEKIIKNANGFLFNEFDNIDNKISIAGSFGFFESLFLGNHGTVIKYSKVGKKVKPVLDSYEFLPEDDNNRIINNLQNGAIDFCNSFYNELTTMEYDFSEISFLPVKKTCVKPTCNEIKMFKNIMFNDTNNERIIANKSILFYILHIKQFVNDFYKSVWKMGFLKNVFKIYFPYYKIYFHMKRREINKSSIT